ncbi:hypothetical protein [Streptomyces luteolus]|uniref:Uncharacterized protein n=1 Tax=Streptomyces luteolus TaxID=3043615 RepID=A0ABT6T6W3_9ACTN|nr:hypothetical protein [Streptomyces sp. B-S-A12]MDI3423633.1 hypothetical protein [Streptomyces sp. B-S-A12]
MPTHTQKTTGTAVQAQGSHCWVLTLELPGRMSTTSHGAFTPPSNWTRYDAFMAIKDEVARQNPELTNANVVFFSIEPNQL